MYGYTIKLKKNCNGIVTFNWERDLLVSSNHVLSLYWVQKCNKKNTFIPSFAYISRFVIYCQLIIQFSFKKVC